MVRLLGQNTIQDFGSLLLAGVRLVGGARGSNQRQREKNGGLAVFRVARGELPHGVAPGSRALGARQFVRTLIKDFDRRNVAALAPGLGSTLPRLVYGGHPL